MPMSRLLNGAALGALLIASNAYAADTEVATEEEAPVSYPFVEGTAYIEFGDDYIFATRPDDPGSEINDLYFYGTLDLKFGLTPILSVDAGITGDDMLGEYVPGQNRAFKDFGIYMHALNVQADVGNASFLAGKFHPKSGLAWDVTPGVFGTYFAEDYELTEMVGASGSYTFSSDTMGSHTLGAAVFFADTSFLSDSIITSRGRRIVDDGGAANTEKLNNFVVWLEGSEIPNLAGLNYQLSYRHLAAGTDGVADENAFIAGVYKDTELSNGDTLSLMGEIAHLQNAGGYDYDTTYFTAGAAYYKGQWHGELSGTIRKYHYSDDSSSTDKLLQVSGGYTFENGFDIAAGYGYQRIFDGVADDIGYHTVGLRLTKTFEFGTNK